MRPVFLLSLLLALAACSSTPVRRSSPIAADASRERLFPDGTYQHDVTLSLPGGRTQTFKGVVSLSPERVDVVGLGPFNATVFKIHDDLASGSPPEVKIYVDKLRGHEAKLREFYGLLKQLMLLPAKPATGDGLDVKSSPDGFPRSVTPQGAGPHATLFFDEYDDHKIPRHLKVQGDRFAVDVKVTAYDL